MVIMILTAVSVAMGVFILHIHSLGDRSYRVPPWLHNLVSRYLARLVGLSHIVKHRQRDISDVNSCYFDEASKPLRVDCEDLNGRYRLIQVQRSGLYILARDDENTLLEKDEKQEINDLHKIREQGGVLRTMKAVMVRQISEETIEENHHSNHHHSNSGGVGGEGGRLRLGHQKPTLLWHDISEILDRFFFWVAFIANTVSTMCILVVLPLSKPNPLANYDAT